MEKTIFVIDYGGGCNFNFECTCEELENVLPPHLKPVPIKILEGDESAKYLLSLYTADLQLEGVDTKPGRSDLFTYVRDKDNKLGLCFISAFVYVPLSGPKKFLSAMNNFLATDPHDFSVAYPHHDAENITITDSEFIMKVKGSFLRYSGGALATEERFHRDFVCANSQIYRGSNGCKNVNFFNQDFMDVKVISIDHEETVECIGDLASDIHPLCKKLASVQYYRSPTGHKPIRWYFETS